QGFEVDEERDQQVGGADLLSLLPPRLADTGHAPTVEFAHVSSSPPEFALLAPDAIKLRSCADEQALLRDGDARSQVAVALVAHRGRVQDLELLARLHHVNVAALAHEINFAVGAGGRRFDLRRAARLPHPFDLATLRNDTGNRFPIAAEDIKPVLIK